MCHGLVDRDDHAIVRLLTPRKKIVIAESCVWLLRKRRGCLLSESWIDNLTR